MTSRLEPQESSYSATIQRILIPHPCPFSLVRIGGQRDGAYLLPDDLKGVSACFSPGVNNYKYFEDVLAKNYAIKAHMCDYSSDLSAFKTPLIPRMQSFEKKWLSPVADSISITLEEWVSRYSPNPSEDLILQMDIEGAEYPILLETDDSILNRFRIIVLELHGLEAFANESQLKQQIGPALSRLNRTHVCVHAHPNNCSGEFHDNSTGLNIPHVLEITLIRRDRLVPGRPLILPSLPHRLDIPFNVVHNLPLHLNHAWLNGHQRSYESQIKIYSDNIRQASAINSVLLMKALRFSRDTSVAPLHTAIVLAKLVILPYLVFSSSLLIIVAKGIRRLFGF